ncbi:MAG: hypothetical protein ABR582_03480 [Gemmatimonadaceae bacterium]
MTGHRSRGIFESLRHRCEPLWIAALAVQFVVLGKRLIPAVIHLVGRGGQVETVEWAIYMSLLVAYLPLVLVIAWWLPRATSGRVASSIRLLTVILAVLELGYYALYANWIFLLSAVMGSIVTVVALDYVRSSASQSSRGRGLARMLPVLLAAAFAWMCAGSLVSWGDALSWIATSPRTALVLIASIALSAFALRELPELAPRKERFDWLDVVAIALLAVFSFRTFPMVEFYHWGFYVGPIEQLRQGGRLLWDTPSQYGFLSILIPTVLPGSAWVAFWFYQSVVFAVVAGLMYNALRKITSRWIGAAFAFAVTLTTLFFRPRDETLILPAQMTPSGGPVRFFWSFVLLAFIAGFFFRSSERQRPRDFVVGGTLIWLASILWSAEGAVYCSAIWFLAFAVFLLQRVAQWRELGLSSRDVARRVMQFIAVPAVGLSLTVAALAFVYLLFFQVTPDWRGYIEYVLLYSRGGFGALPVDPSGPVWFLLLIFFVISTIAGMFLVEDARDPRLVPLAALWGCAWSVESYFVGRSHPVNALSLLPILLFAVAIAIRIVRSDRSHRWQRLVFAALVPGFAMPIALTLGHANFAAEVKETQLPLSRFTEQLPLMSPSLFSLLRNAGARPADSYVLIGDGRLMLPAWPTEGAGATVTSDRSWLPKPYEIIGSLDSERRQVYIDRSAQRFPEAGWLIHSKRDTIQRYSEHRAQIGRVRKETRHFENKDWILSWTVLR